MNWWVSDHEYWFHNFEYETSISLFEIFWAQYQGASVLTSLSSVNLEPYCKNKKKGVVSDGVKCVRMLTLLSTVRTSEFSPMSPLQAEQLVQALPMFLLLYFKFINVVNQK